MSKTPLRTRSETYRKSDRFDGPLASSRSNGRHQWDSLNEEDEDEECPSDREKSDIKLETCGKRSLFRGNTKEKKDSCTDAILRESVDSNQQNDVDDVEDFDFDLPSDLPSGLVDIEGNIIGTIRLGEEEDEFGGDDLENLGDERRLSQARKLSLISNGRVFTHGRGYHLHNHCHRHEGVNRDNSTSAQSNSSTSTITQHYYPEGGWGWMVLLTASLCHVLLCGLNFCVGLMIWAIMVRFGTELRTEAGLLGTCSVGISLFLSPVWVAICKRKSTRLAAVFGGLVASLGCLFASFATQFHQVFFSYSIILGIGVGLTRDASSLMVGQYFKRKRDLVEIMVVGASGLGILVMSILINNAINSLGWRLGLQAITGGIFLCFFLGTCYRSASLYHPQRRAILHLKNQKRKVKEKEKRYDKPPFIDFGCLRSKTVQILLLSSAFSAVGIYTPLFYLEIDTENRDPWIAGAENVSLLYVYVGVCWIVGCLTFGILVVQKSKDCRVSKQYLCQVSAIICGLSMISLTTVKGQSGLIIFCCIYGFSLGGYSYALKIYTYEKVRARHFPRAWSFIQSSQVIPMFVGVPLTGYLNDTFPAWRCGYYLSAVSVFLGAICLFLTNVRKRRLSRRKPQNSSKSSTKTCETTMATTSTSMGTTRPLSPKLRRLSFAYPVEQASPESRHEPGLLLADSFANEGVQGDPSVLAKELACISEEAIADMDFQDIYYEEWEDFLGGECITSCNKIEDCLESEFQAGGAIPVTRAGPAAAPNNNVRFPSKFQYRRPAKGDQAGPLVAAAAVAHSVVSLGTKLPFAVQNGEPSCNPHKSSVETDLLLSSVSDVPPADVNTEQRDTATGSLTE